MTINQVFFAIAGLMLIATGFIKYYLDAKLDPLSADVKRLVDYLILHEGKIARHEERIK